MLGRTRNKAQLDIFEVPLERLLDSKQELFVGATHIDWEQVEEHFTPFYSQRGRPSIPPRKLIGMMLLKERFSLSDEKVMKLWPENPYWQYFCGEVHFQTKRPFQTKELSNFRRRIGAEGLALIRSISLKQFGKTDDKTYKTYSDRRKRSFWRRIVGV